MSTPEEFNSATPPTSRNPYRGVLLVLLMASLFGLYAAIYGGFYFSNPVLLDCAISLGLSAGILMSVLWPQSERTRAEKVDEEQDRIETAEQAHTPVQDQDTDSPVDTKISPPRNAAEIIANFKTVPIQAWPWLRDLSARLDSRILIALLGLMAIMLSIFWTMPLIPPPYFVGGIATVLCLLAAGLAATAARYLAGIGPAQFPQGPALARGARVLAWVLVLAAFSVVLASAGQELMLRMLHFAVLAVDAAVCRDLLVTEGSDLPVLRILGNRANIVGSGLDFAEQQLGIDLRSTWALTVVRRTVEPLVILLCVLGWLSTSLTIVGVEEQGLVERLGVPVAGTPLPPGLHLHWPWPVDRIFRIPVQRVQALQVGHEGEEGGGPENVLWTVEHAPSEYTLLLGNGRDLITVDAAVQFRITDPRAWHYHSQNPADALRAIAYRAVMRSTVNRTLSEALSENVVTLTQSMRDMVQHDADALDLGVTVVGFTIGGMHPPVRVADAYEAVVSAGLRKVTRVVEAEGFRNRYVPGAEGDVISRESAARADGAQALAKAAGEAWAFRAIESQYRPAPEEFIFRRRLEALEQGLSGRHFTIVDFRFQRDGGELWLRP